MNKLESEEVIKQDIPFDLAELLSKANTERQMQAAEKLIEYKVDWERSDMKYTSLIGNPLYLARILNIVAENAIKFTNAGGCIQVWCEKKAENAEQVIYQFGCSDNGIGMSEEFLSHAFDMFAQENETSRARYEGTGLGLAMARKIADRLGGTIEIESKKGCGTTVLMTLPFRIGESSESEEKNVAGTEAVSLEGLRALVAEDNELNMEIVKFMLEENGIQADCAGDGLDAVSKFEKSEPGYYDVICMDIMMPHMNGWDAARKIRSMKREDAHSIPIIAMSANSFTEDIINSRISGMNRHVAKPLDMKKLLHVIQECIGSCARQN